MWAARATSSSAGHAIPIYTAVDMDRNDAGKKDVEDYVTKMVRLLEAKAAAVGVTREEYLDGMIRGTYPQVSSREIDEFQGGDP